MSAVFKTFNLEELVECIFSGGTPSTSNPNYWNGNLNWLSSSETGNRFIIRTEKTITELGVKESSTRLAKIGDVVVASAGQGHTRGQTAYCLIDTYINQSVISIRADITKLNSKYLFYNLTNRYNDLRQISDSFSSRGSLTTKLLKELKIKIPDIISQNRIASILYSLDEKIELNKKMNQTLETIAHTIFKHWFVDFQFPDSTGELEKEIPKGWKVGKLSDILDLAYGKGLKEEDRISGEYPVVGSSGIVGFHDQFLVKGPGIVIGRKGTIGEVIWVETNFSPIDTTFYIKDTIGVEELCFHYFLLRQQDFKKIMSDSAVPGLNRNSALNTEVIVPKAELVVKFNDLIKPFFDRIQYNIDNNITLTKIRDSLLPKLITGQIPVN